MRHVLQHDPIFNPTNSCTFNSNYRNWAMHYQTGLEYAEICPAAFERTSAKRVGCLLSVVVIFIKSCLIVSYSDFFLFPFYLQTKKGKSWQQSWQRFQEVQQCCCSYCWCSCCSCCCSCCCSSLTTTTWNYFTRFNLDSCWTTIIRIFWFSHPLFYSHSYYR